MTSKNTNFKQRIINFVYHLLKEFSNKLKLSSSWFMVPGICVQLIVLKIKYND